MAWMMPKRPAEKQPLAPAEKLKGFRDLAKEAVERAYAADKAGDASRAIALYRTGLQIIEEGLKLNVPSSGLGFKADNASAWKLDLVTWQESVTDRVRALESKTATTSNVPAPLRRSFSGPLSRLPVTHASQQTSTSRSLGRAATKDATLTPKRSASVSAAAVAPAEGPPIPPELAKYVDMIAAEVLDTSPGVQWDDVAGLARAKQALQEAVVLPTLRADIFQGLRAPVRGILLYGPPGNGKTMLGKALATASQATFFSISAGSLTSKWVGDGEKLVRALFLLAARRQPAIIFVDEADALLGARGSANEHDSLRRLKTEFLVQFDGVAGGADRVVVVAATNRPQELDDAVRRRLSRRIYIPLPDAEGRRAVLRRLLERSAAAKLSATDLERLVRATDGYGASDLVALCKEAAMAPIRELSPQALAHIDADRIRLIGMADFAAALKVIKPSVSPDDLRVFEDFTRDYGSAAS